MYFSQRESRSRSQFFFSNIRSTIIIGLSLFCTIDKIFLCAVATSEQSSEQSDINWKCDGCNSKIESKKIFTDVRSALKNFDRLSYLQLDMSWFDRIFESNPYPNVEIILKDISFMKTKLTSKNLFSQGAVEKYDILAFHQIHTNAIPSRHRNLNYHLYIDNFLAKNPCWIPLQEPSAQLFFSDQKEQNYLLFIHLPPSLFYQTCKLFTRIVYLQFPSQCRYDEQYLSTYALPNIGLGHTILNTVAGLLNNLNRGKLFTAPIAEKHLSRLNISYIEAYPNYSITNIKKIRRKMLVIDSDDDARRNLQIMPGDNNTVNNTVNNTANKTGNSTENNSKKDEKNENSKKLDPLVPGFWAWADPKLCPQKIFLNNPWACNFISFSNCSNRVASGHITPERYGQWKNNTIFLTSGNTSVIMGNNSLITMETREKYNDSTSLDDGQWLTTRLLSFMMRPNYQLRKKIVRSILSIKVLTNKNNKNNSNNTNNQNNINNLNSVNNVNNKSNNRILLPDNINEKKTDDNNTYYLQPNSLINNINYNYEIKTLSCIAVHIRHNDMAFDTRVTRSPQADRTLHGHVIGIQKLKKLYNFDQNRIFLATDNGTIPEIVADKYTEFQWYAQHRPMSKNVQLYKMFTDEIELSFSDGRIQKFEAHDSSFLVNNDADILNNNENLNLNQNFDDDILNNNNILSNYNISNNGNSNSSNIDNENNIHKYSVQRDLSHIIADLRFASYCTGMVGVFDSNMAVLMQLTMQGIKKNENKQYFIDLRYLE